MQLTKYLSVLAFVPFLAGANPLAVEDVSSVAASTSAAATCAQPATLARLGAANRTRMLVVSRTEL